ncbi:E3 ubiquitin-protein ligase NRDP1 [Aplysia californica]|uniref:E3 ubiquitin-protein ligase NRDP1 n=1 Tax=Aplysia californica TaxID=6500 RepID=A0ABM0JZP3_APLCA|nr:E3 ubiquitin-protein ligase NRDP1 [Aplysia californica]
MGVDTDRFVSQVNDGLLCSICRDVLEEPLQAPCEHAFCRACIQGWLVNECTCPEDRQPLFLSDLRPLFRYMRNDLDRLQLHCQYFTEGCLTVCTMESLRSHETACDHATVTCPFEDCALSMTRRELEEHVLLCHTSRMTSHAPTPSGLRVCPGGCGLELTSENDAREHSCIAELRTTVEVLRAEMTCRMEDQRRNLEARLDAQRGHMVQREAVLQGQIESLKTEVKRLSDRLKSLLDAEVDRRRELDRMTSERAEILAMLAEIQRLQKEEQGCQHCSGGKSKVTPV